MDIHFALGSRTKGKLMTSLFNFHFVFLSNGVGSIPLICLSPVRQKYERWAPWAQIHWRILWGSRDMAPFLVKLFLHFHAAFRKYWPK